MILLHHWGWGGVLSYWRGSFEETEPILSGYDAILQLLTLVRHDLQCWHHKNLGEMIVNLFDPLLLAVSEMN